jgi:hypothetical protein
MVWGCMNAFGPGYSCGLYEKFINSDLYQYVLGTTYFDTLRYYGLQYDDVIFQQGDVTCHTSDPTYNWMDNKDITYISDWLPNSPDLNPIERLWRHVKLCLGKYPLKASSSGELWELLDIEWNKLSQKTMEPYYKGYPKRIRAVIKARGGYTTF